MFTPGLSSASASPLQEIESWIIQFVEKPNQNLKGWAPCPFARKARLRNEVQLTWLGEGSVSGALEMAAQQVLSDKKKVVLVATDRLAEWPLDKLSQFVEQWRSEHRAKDLHLLRDHPDCEEKMGEVCFNQGRYLIFFVQRRSYLFKASQELEAKGYYNSWPDAFYQRILESRFK